MFTQQLNPPANHEDFESLCLRLFSEILDDPFITLNGVSGQKQNGVDIISIKNDKYIGIQCKKKLFHRGDKLKKSEIKEEIRKAKGFNPKLSEFIIVTTAREDAQTQTTCRELDEENLAKGLFRVRIMGWETIASQLNTRNLQHLCSSTYDLHQERPDNQTTYNRFSLVLKSILNRRFFIQTPGYYDEAKSLVISLLSGEYALLSPVKRADALFRLARLFLNENRELAEKIYKRALVICEPTDLHGMIMRVLLDENDTDKIESLLVLNNPTARGAALISKRLESTALETISWAKNENITPANLDPDSIFVYVQCLLLADRCDEASSLIEGLEANNFDVCPALHVQKARSYLAMTIEDAHVRQQLLNMQTIPFNLRSFPFKEDMDGQKWLKEAYFAFDRAKQKLIEIGQQPTANRMSDFALWLGLRLDDFQQASMARLKDAVSAGERLVYLHFAVEFNVDFDQAESERLLQEKAARITDWKNAHEVRDLAFGHFAMLQSMRDDPTGAYKYWHQNKAIFKKYFSEDIVACTEIELTMAAGYTDTARELLESAESLPQVYKTQLKNFVEGSESDVSLAVYIDAYKATGHLEDLRTLVFKLQNRKEWPQLTQYALKYFERTRSTEALKIVIDAYRGTKRLSEIVNLIESQPEFLFHYNFYIWCAYAEALFFLGNFKKSIDICNQLRNKTDDSEVLRLWRDNHIHQGTWEYLNEYALEQLQRKNELSANQLMETAHIAFWGGAPFETIVLELIRATLDLEPDSADHLMAAYLLALHMGKEDTDETSGWFKRAVDVSDGDRGLQAVDSLELQKLVDDHKRHQPNIEKLWRNYEEGGLPTFMMKSFSNLSHLTLHVIQALSNIQNIDAPENCYPVFAYSGAMPNQVSLLNGGDKIMLDGSALLTLSYVGVLDEVIDLFNVIFPNATFPWLLNERVEVVFHQPSQVEEAKRLKQLVDERQLTLLPDVEELPEDLVNDVGYDLANMLITVQREHKVGKSSVVIQSAPVTRAGSFDNQPIDLDDFRKQLANCQALLVYAREAGKITLAQFEKTTDYLERQDDKAWPEEIEVTETTSIYLSELALSYLQCNGILNDLITIPNSIYISKSSFTKASSFCRYEGLYQEAIKVIESIRVIVSKAVQDGKAIFAPHSDLLRSTKELSRLAESLDRHPSLEMFSSGDLVDVVVSDDRVFNCRESLTVDADQTKTRPVLTSYHLIRFMFSKNVISQNQYHEALAKLRCSGFVYVPVEVDELTFLLKMAGTEQTKFHETAELKAIRLHLALLQSRKLIPDADRQWIANLLKTCWVVLINTWHRGGEASRLREEAKYLWDLMRGDKWQNIEHSSSLLQSQIIQATAPFFTGKVMEEYHKWFVVEVWKPAVTNNPELEQRLLAEHKKMLKRAVIVGITKSENPSTFDHATLKSEVSQMLALYPEPIRGAFEADENLVREIEGMLPR